MLAAIYYGAQYGGSTSSILLNLPGECSGVVTAMDGHRMALMGRAGPALAVAALASLFAGAGHGGGDRDGGGAPVRADHGHRAGPVWWG